MLAKNISWVSYAIDMIEANDLGSNALTYALERQSHVTFVKLGVRSNGTFHYSLVVSKHVALFTDGNSEVFHDLLHANSSSDIFRAIRGSLDGCLFLGVPINQCLVH